MVTGKIIGWVLIALAICFAAAETGAQGVSKQYGIMSAYNVLHTLALGDLIQMRIIIERNIHPILWDPIIRSLLWLPGWLLLGVPGIILVWKFHLQPSMSGPDDDVRNSSYEDIIAAIEEFNESVHDETDLVPSKYAHLNNFDPMDDSTIAAANEELDNFELKPLQKDV